MSCERPGENALGEVDEVFSEEVSTWDDLPQMVVFILVGWGVR